MSARSQQSDTGDRDAALVSISEAVDIRRRLATANPAAYLPDLTGIDDIIRNINPEPGRS